MSIGDNPRLVKWHLAAGRGFAIGPGNLPASAARSTVCHLHERLFEHRRLCPKRPRPSHSSYCPSARRAFRANEDAFGKFSVRCWPSARPHCPIQGRVRGGVAHGRRGSRGLGAVPQKFGHHHGYRRTAGAFARQDGIGFGLVLAPAIGPSDHWASMISILFSRSGLRWRSSTRSRIQTASICRGKRLRTSW